MAKSDMEIEMDFRRAKAEADRLEQLARQMSNIAEERFAAAVRGIDTNWQGEHASAFLNKCARLKEEMAISSRQLKQAADSIRTIAQNTYDAEMNAWQILQAELSAAAALAESNGAGQAVDINMQGTEATPL